MGGNLRCMGDASLDISERLAHATQHAGSAYQIFKPDLILIAGDRYEALGAVSAAMLFNIPVAHIGGGDETIGSYDNQIRNAITKMSHVHFVAHDQAQERVLAMGEEEWRVHVTGLPSIDGIRAWQESHHIAEERGEELMVIFHTPTLEPATAEKQARELGKALVNVGRPIKGYIPGYDILHEKVRRALVDECIGAVESEWLAQEEPADFYGSMARAACLVGNSSAGIIEACSFGLPVVDIGNRQEGRLRPENVLYAQPSSLDIEAAITYGLTNEFRDRCQTLENPYGDGHAVERIMAVLANLPVNDLIIKRWG